MRISGRSFVVRFDGTTAAALLWVASFGLMTWHTITGGQPLGRWAILIGILAGSWTVALVVNHARRVICEVVSYEHRHTRGPKRDLLWALDELPEATTDERSN